MRRNENLTTNLLRPIFTVKFQKQSETFGAVSVSVLKLRFFAFLSSLATNERECGKMQVSESSIQTKRAVIITFKASHASKKKKINRKRCQRK